MRRVVFVVAAFYASGALAEDFVVSSTDDAGPGTFRAAVEASNSRNGSDTIRFTVADGAVVTLTSRVRIEDDLRIEGPGSAKLTLKVSSNGRDVLQVDGTGHRVRIQGLTISGGEDGIEITNNSFENHLTVTDVRVVDQLGDDSISIDGDGNRLRVADSVISGREDGIAVEGNSNVVLIERSCVCSNGEDGVEVDGNSNAVTISDSTIASNGVRRPDDGIDFGGLANSGYILQSTISSNTEDGIDIEGGGNHVFVTRSAIAANVRDGLIFQDPTETSSLAIKNTLVANNIGPDIQGKVTSLGYNLIGTLPFPPSIYDLAEGDMVGRDGAPLDAGMSELVDVGDILKVHRLQPVSPAIDAGDPGFRSTNNTDVDQLGKTRVVNNRLDIGPVEFGNPN